MYDLVDRHDGVIPDRSLEFAPSPRQLAKVENTFYGHKDTLGGGYRYDIPDYGPGIGFREYEKFPSTRTEWVNPLPGASFWYEDHSIFNAAQTGFAQEMRSGDLDYQAGRTYPASGSGRSPARVWAPATGVRSVPPATRSSSTSPRGRTRARATRATCRGRSTPPPPPTPSTRVTP